LRSFEPGSALDSDSGDASLQKECDAPNAAIAAPWNRVLELTPAGIQQYGGGYTEYVARSGHEAPGLHSWWSGFDIQKSASSGQSPNR
jgi:hypothetical protein